MSDELGNDNIKVEGDIDEEAQYWLERIFEYSETSDSLAFLHMVRSRALEIMDKPNYLMAAKAFEDDQYIRHTEELNQSISDNTEKPGL